MHITKLSHVSTAAITRLFILIPIIFKLVKRDLFHIIANLPLGRPGFITSSSDTSHITLHTYSVLIQLISQLVDGFNQCSCKPHIS